MLSVTCKTGIRAVVFLATRLHTGERFSIPAIAEIVGGNEHTIGKLLQTLVKANLIQSAKGPSGGFFMTADQIEQPVLSIVQALDGDQLFHSCALGLSQCSATKPCPLHDQYAMVREELEDLFHRNSIKAISKDVSSGLAFLT